jgi:hypothetical protein
LAAIDNFAVILRGDTLDHGGIQEGVEARVAGLLPFLVLKAYAIEQRDKEKDSYDVVWTLNAFEKGPRSAVNAMAKSPVIDRPEIPVAIGYLRKNFQAIEHRGPSQYAKFERSEGTDEERLRLRRDAYGTLNEFLTYWDSLKLPRDWIADSIVKLSNAVLDSPEVGDRMSASNTSSAPAAATRTWRIGWAWPARICGLRQYAVAGNFEIAIIEFDADMVAVKPLGRE